ncbi:MULTISPECIES: 6,7-dimethyl-8-ribityllumazine synthase [Acidocella]|uniref:6,7-dimethyl-8-ribityllumazine synthase n=1 Tax=Acidocella TaxID=50709 RepID=UPI00028DA261|nr:MULTISPECIES: 6,7-dimethyl-8-ribityllumazine synthase [Acidocella]EKN00470.1 6,7-dimethyl-8-ribityllumazine synthase [Acidocella sp. MX-AZ02]WBO60025.1 6,7-dimethyl-8-ribityllumazine synthase [Acidocella sp. MX-AZ03]
MSTADAPLPVAPQIGGPAPRILVISAPYYRDVVEGMLHAAQEIFAQVKAEVEIIEIAGAYELPQALAIAAGGKDGFDGYVTLGCVVRGETDHYEFVCDAAMTGMINVAVSQRLALGTGLLTVDTLAQAHARSRETGANKGAEAAVACLKQIALKRRFAA